LASNGCYTYQCASWLSEVLTPLRKHTTNIKDTFEFVERIQVGANSVTVSFNVKSLFTNIPVDFVIEIILKEIYGDSSDKKFHGLTKRQQKIFWFDRLNEQLSTLTAKFMNKLMR